MNWEQLQIAPPRGERDTAAIKSVIRAMIPGASVFLSNVSVQSEDVIDFLSVAREMGVRMDVRRVRGKDDGVKITRSMPNNSDLLQLFLDDCEYDKSFKSRSSELYSAYTAHCESKSTKPVGALQFGKRVTARGVKQDTVMGVAWRYGIRLRSNRSAQQGETNV